MSGSRHVIKRTRQDGVGLLDRTPAHPRSRPRTTSPAAERLGALPGLQGHLAATRRVCLPDSVTPSRSRGQVLAGKVSCRPSRLTGRVRFFRGMQSAGRWSAVPGRNGPSARTPWGWHRLEPDWADASWRPPGPAGRTRRRCRRRPGGADRSAAAGRRPGDRGRVARAAGGVLRARSPARCCRLDHGHRRFGGRPGPYGSSRIRRSGCGRAAGDLLGHPPAHRCRPGAPARRSSPATPPDCLADAGCGPAGAQPAPVGVPPPAPSTAEFFSSDQAHDDDHQDDDHQNTDDDPDQASIHDDCPLLFPAIPFGHDGASGCFNDVNMPRLTTIPRPQRFWFDPRISREGLRVSGETLI